MANLPEHPRARGENSWKKPGKNVMRGTSPRTRGKRRQCALNDFTNRNIPAHAGKTRERLFDPFVKGEHPRARGENPY